MSVQPCDDQRCGSERDIGPVEPLLVVIRNEADVAEVLPDAVGRARARRRALVLVIVRPARPLTTDAVLHLRHDEQQARFADEVLLPALARCDNDVVGLVHLRGPRAVTARGRSRALRRRIEDIARRCGAEVHPGPAAEGDTCGCPDATALGSEVP